MIGLRPDVDDRGMASRRDGLGALVVGAVEAVKKAEQAFGGCIAEIRNTIVLDGEDWVVTVARPAEPEGEDQ